VSNPNEDTSGKAWSIWIPVVVATVALIGTLYAAHTTVTTVKTQFSQHQAASLNLLRRNTYIGWVKEAEVFYQADNGDESALRLEEAKALIVATKPTRQAIVRLETNLVDPKPVNADCSNGETPRQHSCGLSDKAYRRLRSAFLAAATTELEVVPTGPHPTLWWQFWKWRV
jgi:hypothetical protein